MDPCTPYHPPDIAGVRVQVMELARLLGLRMSEEEVGPAVTHTPLPPCKIRRHVCASYSIIQLYVCGYLTGRTAYIHTPLPVRYPIYLQRLYLTGRDARV